MRLSGILRFQAIVFALFGIVLFLIPDFYNELYGWEGADTVLGRIIGATFLGVAWIEWRVADGAGASTAWPFVLIPTLFVVGFLWEFFAETYQGTDAWLWTHLGISAFFALLVGGTAMMARE